MIVSWNTTNECNMYCDHCYRESGPLAPRELTTGEARDMIEGIAAAGFRIMIFSGGECLMRSDLEELVAHASALGLRPVLGTNGSLLTRERAQALKDAGCLAAGISLDSLEPAKHDALRKYDGAFEEALAGMRACREAGLPYQIHTTVMDWNRAEVPEMADFAVAQGARAFHVFFLVPVGRAAAIEESSLRAAEYEQLIDKLMEKAETVPIEIKPTCAPQFMRIALRRGMRPRFSKGCLAGTSYCIIGPSGSVQPCAYMNISAGNVRERPFDKIWRDSPMFKRLRTEDYAGRCGSCEYSKRCGGCRARALYYHGDFMAEEPWCLYKPPQEEASVG